MKKNKTFVKKCVPLIATLSATLLLTSCNKKIDPEKLSGSELLEYLHNEQMETHKKYVTYSAFQDYENPSGETLPVDTHGPTYNSSGGKTIKIVGFYTGRLKNSYSGFSREHVWACANSSNLWTHNSGDGSHYVDGAGYKGGGSDLYHIRPALTDINEERGNAKLYEFKASDTKYLHPTTVSAGEYQMITDSESTFANKFEPADQIKGDIARILMYVYTHYANIGDNSALSETKRSYLGGLNLADIFNSAYSLDQIHEILVRWNENDPVDETEKLRNDTVEKIQGNRNPYVDHPEYMRKIWYEDD